jgi:hypothetical protein
MIARSGRPVLHLEKGRVSLQAAQPTQQPLDLL